MAPAPVDHHVLIAGGGLVGLTLAQGLRKRGIKATVFERDVDERTQGFAITFHWILDALEQMYPKEVFDALDSTSVDCTLSHDEGHFLVLNGVDGKPILDIPPSKRRVRAHRGKLRKLLLTGLDVVYGKQAVGYEITDDGVTLKCADGSEYNGTFLVGCDGNNSKIRRQLVGADKAALEPVGVITDGVVQRKTAEQAKQYRDIDPLLFQTINPVTQQYIWHSIQSVADDGESYEFLTMVSHLVSDDPADELPKAPTSKQIIQDMKRRVVGFAEPLKSLVTDIDEDLPALRLVLADWVPCPWDGQGRVAIAGDAAGPMTMYRGEGVNHGCLDATLLCDVITKSARGKVDIRDGLKRYEEEVRSRREVCVPLSRQACLDAHGLGMIDPNSPLVSRRAGPDTASVVIEAA